MERTSDSQSEEIPELTVDALRPVVESFIRRMTSHQWVFLESGSPDDATIYMLEDLLWDVTKLISQLTLVAIKGMRPISEDCVLSSVGSALPQTFAQVMGIREEVRCESSDSLTNLIVTEVTERVNSSLSPELKQRVPPVHRFDAMVSHARGMLKIFTGKIKAACKPRSDRQQHSLTTSLPMDTDGEKEDQVSTIISTPLHSLVPDILETVSVGGEADLEDDAIAELTLEDNPPSDFDVDSVSSLEIEALEAGSAQSKAEEVAVTPTQSPDTTEVNIIETAMPLATGSAAALSCEEKRELDATAKANGYKVAVDAFVESLVLLAFRKSKTFYVLESFDAIYKRLFEKIWAEVKDEDFNIDPEKLRHLDKAVFKILCRKWGSPVSVLTLMMIRDPAVDDVIASIVKEQLLKQSKKPGAIAEFFSSVGKAICKPFRCFN